MRHDPASAAIVIMLRSLKMHGMSQAVTDLTGNDSFRFKASSAVAKTKREATHVLNFSSDGVILVTIMRSHSADSRLVFEVAEEPKPGHAFAASLAATLMVSIVVFQAGDGTFGAVRADEIDGDEVVIVSEYDPFG